MMYAKEGYLRSGDPTTLVMLAKAGANSETADMFGRTLFDYVSAGQAADIRALLEAARTDRDDLNGAGLQSSQL